MIKLYKKDSRGKTRIWSAEANEDGYTVRHGLIGGEIQVEEFPVPYGLVNRTKEEQIQLRMNSRATKKKNGGYVESVEDVQDSNKNQLGLLRPMLAHKFKDESKIDFANCFIQRKYDGHRCIITKQDGVIHAYSRGGKVINSINHITACIQLNEGETVDGELYVHGLKLQKIASMVRQQKEQSPELDYIIYDKMSDKPFVDRISDVIQMEKSESIKMADTIVIHNINEANGFFMQFRAEGYEGAIIRHGNKGYQYGKRSQGLIKMKEFDDDEFKVIGVVASVEGWARLVCKTKEGKNFKCSAPGNHEEKREVLLNIENYIGKFVRVEYAGFTLKGKPSQPVATMWRDKDNE